MTRTIASACSSWPRSTGDPILFGAPALGRGTARWVSTTAPTWSRAGQGRGLVRQDPARAVRRIRADARRCWATSSIASSPAMGDMIPGREQTIFDVKGAQARRADLLREHLSGPVAAAWSNAAPIFSSISPTTPGTATARRHTNCSRWRRCARSRPRCRWCASPTPESAR